MKAPEQPSGTGSRGPEDPWKSPSAEGAAPGTEPTHTPDPAAPAAEEVVSAGQPIPAWAWKSKSSSGSGGNSANQANSGAAFMGRVLADRWEVRARIGMGGMASVHEGQDRRLGRLVAVKILHPHIAENPDSRERLAREARAIAQLKHENVIEVYDYSIDDADCTWLVTELIEGASLRQILDRVEKPMPEVALMIVTEVVRALRAAHQVGIVHRDVKPDNILVGKEGRPKLSDFGIAQIVNEQRMTLTGNLVGSPSYMSPEQANGKRTDHRTDLYSAGILLYRTVTGTLPFRGENAIETIRKVSIGEYTDPVELEPGCAGPIAGIIRRALSFGMNDRYQSADEMLQELGAVLQDAGLSATWEELPQYFQDPHGYQEKLRPRLARELESRGRALLDAGQEARAVDCFNRAMSLGESSQRTLDLVRELSRRRGQGRVKKIAWTTGVALGAVALISGILLVTDRLLPTSAATPDPSVSALFAETEHPPPSEPRIEPPPAQVEVAPPEEAPPASAEVKTEPPATPARADEPRRSKTRERADRRKKETPPPEEEAPRALIAAAEPERLPEPPPAPVSDLGTLHIGTSVWADISVDGKVLGRAPEQSKFPLPAGKHQLRATHPNCLPDEREFTIAPGETTRLRVQITCP